MSVFYNFFSGLVSKVQTAFDFRSFFKYLFDRFLSDFIDREISFADIKDGVMNQIRDLPLKVETINRRLLYASPYILSSGHLDSIQINLPSLKDISTKSIEFRLGKLDIVLMPNKNYEKGVSKAIVQLLNDKKYFAPSATARIRENEEHSSSIFKSIFQKILFNFRVDLDCVQVKLFTNTPTPCHERIKSPCYFLLARLSRVLLGRPQESQFKMSEFGVLTSYDKTYGLQVKQFGLFLLREDQELKGLSEEGSTVPQLHYPHAVARLGHNFEHCLKLLASFEIATQVMVKLPCIQITLQPIQLVVLSRFMDQLKFFRRSRDKVNSYIKYKCIDVESEKREIEEQGCIDLNSSLKDIGSQIKKAMHQLSLQEAFKQPSSPKLEADKQLRVSFSLLRFNLILMKHQQDSELVKYRRSWLRLDSKQRFEPINFGLRASYFQFRVQNFQFKLAEQIEITVRNADLMDVLLSPCQESGILESCSPLVRQDKACVLKHFDPKDQVTHYCCNYLFKLLCDQQQPIESSEFRLRKLLTQPDDKKAVRITVRRGEVTEVAGEVGDLYVAFSLRQMLDLVHLVRPARLYGQLCEQINNSLRALNEVRPVQQQRLPLQVSQYIKLEQSIKFNPAMKHALLPDPNEVELTLSLQVSRTFVVFEAYSASPLELGQLGDLSSTERMFSPENCYCRAERFAPLELRVVIDPIELSVQKGTCKSSLKATFQKAVVTLGKHTLLQVSNSTEVRQEVEAQFSNLRINVGQVLINLSKECLGDLLAHFPSQAAIFKRGLELSKHLESEMERINRLAKFKPPSNSERQTVFELDVGIALLTVRLFSYSLSLKHLRVQKSCEMLELGVCDMLLLCRAVGKCRVSSKEEDLVNLEEFGLGLVPLQQVLLYANRLQKPSKYSVEQRIVYLKLENETVKCMKQQEILVLTVALDNLILRSGDLALHSLGDVRALAQSLPREEKQSAPLRARLELELNDVGVQLLVLQRDGDRFLFCKEKLYFHLTKLTVSACTFRLGEQNQLQQIVDIAVNHQLSSLHFAVSDSQRFLKQGFDPNRSNFVRLLRLKKVGFKASKEVGLGLEVNVEFVEVQIWLCLQSISFLLRLKDLLRSQIENEPKQDQDYELIEDEQDFELLDDDRIQFQILAEDPLEERVQFLAKEEEGFRVSLLFQVTLIQFEVRIFQGSFFSSELIAIEENQGFGQENDYRARIPNCKSSIVLSQKNGSIRVKRYANSSKELRVDLSVGAVDCVQHMYFEKGDKRRRVILKNEGHFLRLHYQLLQDGLPKHLLKVVPGAITLTLHRTLQDLLKQLDQQIGEHRPVQARRRGGLDPLKLYVRLQQFNLVLTLNWSIELGMRLPLSLLKEQLFRFSTIQLVYELPKEKKMMKQRLKNWVLESCRNSLNKILTNSLARLLEFAIRKSYSMLRYGMLGLFRVLR